MNGGKTKHKFVHTSGKENCSGLSGRLGSINGSFTGVEMKSVRGSTACLKLYCFSKISKAVNQEFPFKREKHYIEKTDSQVSNQSGWFYKHRRQTQGVSYHTSFISSENLVNVPGF